MAKELTSVTASYEVEDLNACVSTTTRSHRPARKETTFREWLLENQIGMLSTDPLSLFFLYYHAVYQSWLKLIGAENA